MCRSRLSRYGMSGAPAGYGFTRGEHTLVSDDLQTNPASLTTTLAALFRPSYVCRERTSSYIAPDVMKL
jgi:hypothetical protein